MADFAIADAEERHLAGIAAIYAEAARATAATFDFAGHEVAWWRAALRDADERRGRLLIVAVRDGAVLGYAKSGQHRDKAAYDVTCETSVYIGADARGEGIGGALYGELLRRLDDGPLRLAVAGVTQPNEASTRLHARHGFRPVGTFTGIGVKAGRAWDVTWFQRELAEPPLVHALRGADGQRAEALLGEAGYEASVAGGVLRVAGATDRGDDVLLEWCAEVLGLRYG